MKVHGYRCVCVCVWPMCPWRLGELHGKFCTISNGRVPSSSVGMYTCTVQGAQTIKHNVGVASGQI